MRIAAVIVALVFPLLFSAAAGAQVKTWKYVGVDKRGGETVLAAEASVSDDTLALVYYPRLKSYSLWFTYRGNVAFSSKLAGEAEIFMRTRREAKLKGRFDSDYVFKGATLAHPNPNPKAPQAVVANLVPEDIEALRDYEQHKVIGVSYYIANGTRKNYSLPTEGLWAAYQRIRAEANARGTKVSSQPSSTTRKIRAAGRLLSVAGAERHFLHCSTLADRYQRVKGQIAKSNNLAGPLMRKFRRLRSEVKKLEREAKNAERKAYIIQSNENVQRRFRQAVRRYDDAIARYKKLAAYVEKQGTDFDVLSKSRDRLDKLSKTKCGGRWNTALAQRYCKSGNSRHANFCTHLSFKSAN